MPKHSKRYNAAQAKVDRLQYYAPADAMRLVKETATAKFDETIEVHMRMGVDPRYAEQQVRGVVTLPSGTGRQVRILVFAGPDGQVAARRHWEDQSDSPPGRGRPHGPRPAGCVEPGN